MFITFFYLLKNSGIPLGTQDLLNLLRALDETVIEDSAEDFYYLCRAVLVKDEKYLDQFDRIFSAYFDLTKELPDDLFQEISSEWLKKGLQRILSEEDKNKIESLGGLDKLMERLNKLLEEQKKRHEGGNKWVGTGGSSPFGGHGYHPEGFRMTEDSAGNRTGIKVWQQRHFKNLDGNEELDTRNIKMVLKNLRLLTREGHPEELDLNKTIDKTSKNGGMIDIAMVPSKKNNVKVLLFFDVGGSMDDHVLSCERLFSAAKYEFKHMKYFYFHNCIYESVWTDNTRKNVSKISVFEILRTYSRDYKIIFVGDASMSPIELTYEGGSVEHWNEEAGLTWMQRIKDHFNFLVWLNPTYFDYWKYSASIKILQDFFDYKMFPLTLNGIKLSMKALQNRKIKFQ
jgi:hypothetical protein